jgi:hypothetical protein
MTQSPRLAIKKHQETSIGLGYNSVAEVPYGRVTSSRTVRWLHTAETPASLLQGSRASSSGRHPDRLRDRLLQCSEDCQPSPDGVVVGPEDLIAFLPICG